MSGLGGPGPGTVLLYENVKVAIDGGTVKVAVSLHDGTIVETVISQKDGTVQQG